MIVDVIKDDVLYTTYRHIVFPMSTEGICGSGFSRDICDYIFGFEDEQEKEEKLGKIIPIIPKIDTKYYGIVCFSEKEGWWDYIAKAIKKGLNNLQIPEEEIIAVAMLETGFIDFVPDYYAREIVEAIHTSTKKCVIYSYVYSKKEIFSVIKKK